ncbi:subtilisin-like protease SBT3.15 [Raphanus sativus]|uniref:Subtilisin-like protease SBT3.15 n=1 Tax=Raphanus sativus TaxID=3726 RepID=A0A9W3CJC0_RAPSA|nr:subtilisin-like protease SBT3.15 [Raphanus sativus]
MENSLQSHRLVLLFSFSLVLFLASARATENNSKVYIVYLGEREHDDPELVTATHHQMLESLHESKEDAHNSMIYSYQHGFSGFAAFLTSSQAKKISEHPSVVHVIPNRILKLKTTRTWDLLGLSQSQETNMGSEAIIGLLDTGIWPESEVFNDQGFGPIPKRWRGKCKSGKDFNATTHCNKKPIGAKYYIKGLMAELGNLKFMARDFKSNRDAEGHGTHTATIAGGSFVTNASFNGLALGMVRGGAPRARIASYKVCWTIFGCSSADMWKAYDDAIHDGVDVLSVSIGGDIPEGSEVDQVDFVATFHAVARGIPVVAAAGNKGPGAQLITNVAPWFLTVAATTLDRSFPTKITLGNNQTYYLVVVLLWLIRVNLCSLDLILTTGLAFFDLRSGGNITNVKGKTLLVFDKDVSKEGIAAVILAQNVPDESYPYILTSYEQGVDILQYIRTTRSPTVRISAATTLTGPPEAAKVVAFSSRGPNPVSPAILKPDIAASGVNILAALSPLDPESHNGFGLLSGTSMSTPVVSGITALLKCLHPDWSPAAIRSALVTTAWTTSKSGEPILAEGSNKKIADPFDYGGGLVNPESAADPGLVYDMGIKDYISYMCSAGYNDTSITRVLGKKTTCPSSPGASSILDINLPSITIPNLDQEVTLTRSLTNAGPNNSVYKAVIESPLGITLTVYPTTLVFGSGEVLSFKVRVKTRHKVNTGYFFGSLTWTDGVHDVRIPVSVQTKIMTKP